LKQVLAAIAIYDEKIDSLARAHPDYALMNSFPGAGLALTPRLITAMGSRRERYQIAHEIQCYRRIAVYPDALYVKMREGRVENRAVYVAIGIDLEGRKDVLGLWTSGNEGAKFWFGCTDRAEKSRVKDILIVCIDGLKGFPQAIEAGTRKRRCAS
jgi:transposase-like protein